MNEPMKIILFKMNDQKYGLDVNQIQAIERLQEVTQIPKSVDFLKGIVNLRGIITPIIELKERLELGTTNYNNETRILIVTFNHLQIGLIVDSATDVIDIDRSVIEPPPKIMTEINDNMIDGVAKLKEDLIMILDLKNLFSLEEIKKIEAV